MKIKVNGTSLPGLSDILRRRQQTLESYMSEMGLADWAALERHCEEAGVRAPVRPVVEVPVAVVESTSEAVDVTTVPLHKPKKKLPRNALVTVESSEGEKKPD